MHDCAHASQGAAAERVQLTSAKQTTCWKAPPGTLQAMSAHETREPSEPRPTSVVAEKDGLPWEQRRWAILASPWPVA